MATLVLGTIGRAIGGPVGGIIGTLVGGFADRAIFGGGKPREGARAGNLAVQASTYGDPIPRLHGVMRVAGNLIWTSGIVEHSSTSGGGKRGGTGTTSYTYSASFAVGLSARPVARIGRIWADGKLLRDGGGGMVLPATIRLHHGRAGQVADPLIAAAEGATPAYRGLAYAVFEDLALAEYGNRIPNLTFEVVADEGGVDAGLVVADLCSGLPDVDVGTGFPAIGGHVAARAGSVRDQLTGLTGLLDLTLVDDGERLILRSGPLPVAVSPAADDYGSVAGAGDPLRARAEVLAPAASAADAVALGFYDTGRDYQPGLQRAVRRSPAVQVLQLDVPLALDAAAAKALAGGLLARGSAARMTATANLPPRALAVRAGEALSRPGDAVQWRVRRWTLSGFAVELELARLSAGLVVSGPADAGRVHAAGDAPPGPTVLHVLDIPPLPGTSPAAPRLWLAAAGAAPGWRRAPVALSLDDGGSYVAAGVIGVPSVMGVLATGLAAGSPDLWDRHGSVEVRLLAAAMWLEGRDEAAVLGGANLALVGDELVQFAEAVALGGGVFRLSMLLRGRRGSAVGAHAAGTRFVVIEAERLLGLDLDAEQVGRTLRFRAEGAGDVGTAPQAVMLKGASLRPLAPVFLRITPDGGDLLFDWIRRSRSGFAWLDGVDAPVGEDGEGYALSVSIGGAVIRRAAVTAPGWRYTAAMQAVDGPGPASLAVAQSGALGGLPATIAFTLS